jgi:hypothetical protein
MLTDLILVSRQEHFNNIDINSHAVAWKLREMIRQIEVNTNKIEIGIEEWKHKVKF